MYTPGPWTAGIETARKLRQTTISINGPDGKAFLADVYDGNGAYPTEANARLIAAAPKLLEALESAQCPCWVHNAALTNDIEKLRAIALWFGKWNNDVRVPAIAQTKRNA